MPFPVTATALANCRECGWEPLVVEDEFCVLFTENKDAKPIFTDLDSKFYAEKRAITGNYKDTAVVMHLIFLIPLILIWRSDYYEMAPMILKMALPFLCAVVAMSGFLHLFNVIFFKRRVKAYEKGIILEKPVLLSKLRKIDVLSGGFMLTAIIIVKIIMILNRGNIGGAIITALSPILFFAGIYVGVY